MADEAIQAIREFEHIECVPLVAESAEYAARLCSKYSQRGERELSYADAISCSRESPRGVSHAVFGRS